MSVMTEEDGQASASLTRAYARLLSNELLPSRSGDLPNSAYPLRCRAPVELNDDRLQAYRRLLGLPAADLMPPLYPQVAAMPLHLQLLSTPGLPGRRLGVVHLGQRVRWKQSMERPREEQGRALDLEVSLRPGAAHPRGRIFHMETVWRDPEGVSRWEAESLLLFRGVGAPDGADVQRLPPSAPRVPAESDSQGFECPAGIGRSYARVSGDWNPIHLSSMSARLFGFQCPIVHGMWTLAKALVTVEERHPTHLAGTGLEAWFTAPLFWPSESRLHVSPAGDWFQVDRDSARRKPALWGRVSPLAQN